MFKITILQMSNEAARWLRKKRSEEGKSYRELGKLVGLSHTLISNAEQLGEGTPDTWIVLAEHYHESILRVLYWAKKIKRPPSDDDVITELGNRLIVQMVESFPREDQERVLKRLALELEEIHDRRQRNHKTQMQDI